MRCALPVLVLAAVALAGVAGIVVSPSPDVRGDDTYMIGMAIEDVTGPAAEEGMMGYAMLNQRTRGIHTRLFVRCFAIGDEAKKNVVVYCSCDLGMVMQGVFMKVVAELQHKFGPSVFTYRNVLLSATHTHAGPGAFSWHALYDVTTWGFDKHHYQAQVTGLVSAISKAYTSMAPGRIRSGVGKIGQQANINRSPSAYLNNPAEERKRYPDGNTDKDMTVLRFEDLSGKDIGHINWFSVHGTSMNNTNKLISSDNKGIAAMLFEREKNGIDVMPGKGKFVAAFGQTNEGDSSPNTDGAKCPNGKLCDFYHSTCDGDMKTCIGHGPGRTDKESCMIIAARQLETALKIHTSSSLSALHGPVDSRLTWIDMPHQTLPSSVYRNGGPAKTCPASMGYSFAAGTTDGPGDFDFRQGDNSTGNPFWNFVRNFLAKPTKEEIACQHPKPILLDVGTLQKPFPWVPNELPVSLLRIGNFVIIGVPGEFTTMSGRRTRATVLQALQEHSTEFADATVVIAGLANTYSGYTATYEEFQVQRYEGASTMWGPHQLEAYQMNLARIAGDLAAGRPSDEGKVPPDLTGKQYDFQPGVIADTAPAGHHFGDVIDQPHASYARGATMKVSFWSAHPKNNYEDGDSYCTIERQVGSAWQPAFTDGSPETTYEWVREGGSHSIATCTWEIPAWAHPGTYRVHHKATSKSITQHFKDFEGISSTFTVA